METNGIPKEHYYRRKRYEGDAGGGVLNNVSRNKRRAGKRRVPAGRFVFMHASGSAKPPERIMVS